MSEVGGARHGVFQGRVGGYGGAVDQLHLGPKGFGIEAQSAQARQNRRFGGLGGGEDFRHAQLGPVEQDEVREGAARIDAEDDLPGDAYAIIAGLFFRNRCHA